MSEYQRKPNEQESAAPLRTPAFNDPNSLPLVQHAPSAQAVEALKQFQLQRRQQDLQLNVARSPEKSQRQAAPVLEAMAFQREAVGHLAERQASLQRQVSEMQPQMPEGALQAAVQRSAAPQPLKAQPTSPADWVRVAQLEVQRVHDPKQPEQTRMLSTADMNAHKGVLQTVSQRLSQGFKADRSPPTQRYAEYGEHLATLQRHGLTSIIPRHFLTQISAVERPSVQRAIDEALQRLAERDAQDHQALTLQSLQRQLAEVEVESEQPVMARIQARRGSGQPLPETVQRQLEAGLNFDLSRVRIHDDSEADVLAKQMHAVAFTTGQDIYFRSGKFNPNTRSGLELIAHEATHVKQQSSGQVGKGVDPDARLEAEAQHMGQVIAKAPTQLKGRGVRPVARQTQAAQTAPASSMVQRKASPTATTAPHTAAPGPSVAQATQKIHELIESLTVNEPVTGTPATLLVGVEKAASMRLGSTRKLVKQKNILSGPRYNSMGDGQSLLPMLRQLKVSGQLPAVLAAYQAQYGQTLYAVLGERVRDASARQKLLTLLPDPIGEAQLTHDTFLEQLAIGYSYLNDSAEQLQAMTKEKRRGSNPNDLLTTFGYQAGAAIQGKWGFQMRVFTPIPGKARWPGAIVAFRGTEGISVDPKKPETAEGALDTIVGDAAPAGVGYNQMDANAALIAVNMKAAAKYGPMTLVGHSLGGALAQIAGVRFMAQTRQVVTFQSPAIQQADVDKLSQYNAKNKDKAVSAHHYRIDGDIVPTAGEADLPGSITYFDRISKPHGSKGPYSPVTLSGDMADMSRIASGHVTPMLSTYLRGRGGHSADQNTLIKSGLRDEMTLDAETPEDVAMVAAGNYTTRADPRLNAEQERQTTAVKAMRVSGTYQAVFEANIAYNTLLASIENLAQDPKAGQSYQTFRAAAVALLENTTRLPMTEFDKQMAEKMKLPMAEKNYRKPLMTGTMIPAFEDKPTVYGEALENGVEIPNRVKDGVLSSLDRIWMSWNPGQSIQ